MGSKLWLAGIAAMLAAATAVAERTSAPASPRSYVFENGSINGLDPGLFDFWREELAEVDFVTIAYPIVHPRGTLMFDWGAVRDSHFPPDGSPVLEGVVTATKPLLPQLEALGYSPADIDCFALSHFHSDHTGNANSFANAAWIVKKAKRDYMFAGSAQGIIQPATYAALRNARMKILDNEDSALFGDGSVVVMATPGHNPGRQVVAVRLASARIARDVHRALEPGGTFIATFRDLSVETKELERFIPLRSDDETILMCFLEFEPETVKVHDLVSRARKRPQELCEELLPQAAAAHGPGRQPAEKRRFRGGRHGARPGSRRRHGPEVAREPPRLDRL